jgi:hypothetical protein
VLDGSSNKCYIRHVKWGQGLSQIAYDFLHIGYLLDVLWGQLIKPIQMASNSELRENQWNNLRFFEIVPSYCLVTSEVQT